jgi:drug/metabolite transporter (DMT)-like permease
MRRDDDSKKVITPQTGSAMNIPKNVWWFEVLLYASLVLDALSVAFQDRTPTPRMTEQMINVSTWLALGLLMLLFYFVWLAARRKKSWPRWALVAALALSLISLAQVIGERGIQFDVLVDTVSCALTALGLYLSFTGDAKDWFDA